MKKRFLFVTAIVIITAILSLGLIACNKDGEQTGGRVPVYQGMTIAQDLSMAKTPLFAAGSGIEDDYQSGEYYGDYEGRNEDLDQDLPFEEDNLPTIEEKAESTLDVIGAADKIYYADKNQDIYITIKLSNPDSYEIMSFTLNGNKYSSYMFEQGSNMENLILKVEVGDAAGIIDYTIDAIKYIDGTEIKDVLMDGDKTVKAGIRSSDQTYANITNESVSLTQISFAANIVDIYNLIDKSGGDAKAALYDGTNIIYKDIEVGQQVEVSFDNLTPNTLYQYGIVALYDDLGGGGAKLNILYKKAVYTNTIVLFDDISVAKTWASWDYLWDSGASDQTITALSLWQNGSKIKDLSKSAKTADSLYTANEYTIKAQYNNLKGDSEEIQLSFTTLANAAPAMSIKNATTTQTSVSFGIGITDSDSVGNLTKIELLHGSDNPIVASGTEVREFTDLLSNNDYTIRATYTYDLNDGEGEHTIVKTADVQTLAKATPIVSIIDVESTQTSVSFGIGITDTDSVGSLTKIELLHEGDNPIVASGTEIREFTDLLSNNDYTVRATYTYDLNDALSAQILTISYRISTLAKAIPTLEINNVNAGQEDVTFALSVTDPDNLGEITAIELYKDETLIESLSDLTKREFSGLESYIQYQIKLIYTYNLNDGQGEKTLFITRNAHTLANITIQSTSCRNTSSVSMGDTIVLEATITNPNEITITKALINGKAYPVSEASNKQKIRIEVIADNDFEGGQTKFTFEGLYYVLNNEEKEVKNFTNNEAFCFINGELYVKSLEIVDENFNALDMAYVGETLYYLVTLANETGYDIDSITIYDEVHKYDRIYSSEYITLIDSNHISINASLWGGWEVASVTLITYSNSYLGQKTKIVNNISYDILIMPGSDIVYIHTVNELKNMDAFRYYKLANDIDLSGIEWSPVSFQGVFDGDGYTIYNMRTVRNYENQGVKLGLFNENANGIIKNLNIKDYLFMVTLSCTDNMAENMVCAGAVAGYLSGHLELQNVHANGEISVIAMGRVSSFVGGLIGVVVGSFATIIDSDMTGSINLTNEYAADTGSLIGRVHYSTATIINSDAYTNYADRLIGNSVFSTVTIIERPLDEG